MPFMEELRKLFRKGSRSGEPVEIDFTGTQAEGLSGAVASAQPDQSIATAQRRKPSLAEVQRGYDEVMNLVQKIGDHLDAQNKRTERLVQLMERLPEAIDSLPEVHRQNAKLMEVMNQHLAHSRERDETLEQTLERLHASSGHQAETLQLLQQQFDAGRASAERMTETLGSFSSALTGLAENNNRSTEVLSGMLRSTEQRESQLVDTIGRMQKWMIGVLIGVGALVIVAIALALLAIMQ